MRITKEGPGDRPPYTYEGEVAYRDDDLMALRCIWTAIKPFAVGDFRLEQGDVMIECYYLAEWFNIFAIYSPQGTLKGWYCNITEPPTLTEEEIRWRDLALDLLILPDGREILLDEDEFEALPLSPESRSRALEALARLREWHAERRFPFDEGLNGETIS